MPFELQDVTKVTFTNSNPRSEFHGDEHVRAIDLSMTLKGENTLLDLIENGLREHHFCNRALQAGQEVLPDVIIPLPNLRFAKQPTKFTYAKGEKWRGYRLTIDFGLGAEAGSNLDFTDCVLASVWYEIFEGGSCEIGWTIQYNGDDMNDDSVYGRLAGLATAGEGHVQIVAPPTLVLVKGKGTYRSGKPDTPPAGGEEDGGDLLDDDDQDTPEKALERSAVGA